MRKTKHVLVVAVCALLMVVTSAEIAPSQQSTAKQMDRFIVRTQLICSEMNRTGQAKWHRQMLMQMGESMGIMAEQVKILDERSQKLAQNKSLMQDRELEADLYGVNAQIVELTRTMENMLQYMEHMTYRFGKMSANTKRHALAQTTMD